MISAAPPTVSAITISFSFPWFQVCTTGTWMLRWLKRTIRRIGIKIRLEIAICAGDLSQIGLPLFCRASRHNRQEQIIDFGEAEPCESTLA